MLKKIIAAVLLGGVGTIFVLQNDYDIKTTLAANVRAGFFQMFSSDLRADVKQIGILSPVIELENITVKPCNDDSWSWACKKYKGQFSWWHLLRYGVLALHVTIEDFELSSKIENNELAVRKHIEKLLEAPALPITMVIQSITLKNVSCVLHEPEKDLQVAFSFTSQTKLLDNMLRSSIYVHDGFIKHKTDFFLEKLSGIFNVAIAPENMSSSVVKADARCIIPCLSDDQKECFFSGSLENESGHFILKNADRSLMVDPIALRISDGCVTIDSRASVPLSYIGDRHQLTKGKLGGTALAQLTAQIDGGKTSMNGHVAFKEVTYNAKLLSSYASASCIKKDALFSGQLEWRTDSRIDLDGSWQWDQAGKKGICTLGTSTAIELPFNWVVPAQSECTFVYHDQAFEGTGNVPLHNVKTNEDLRLKTALHGALDQLVLTADLDNDYHALLKLVLSPVPSMYAQIKYNDTMQLMFNADDLQNISSFKGTVEYPFIRTCLHRFLGYDMQGKGTCVFSGWMDEEKNIHVKSSLQNGTIRLPYTYNFINNVDVHVTYVPKEKKIVLSDTVCSLHKGSVSCAKGDIYFNDNYTPSHLHMPVLFDNCLLNFKKDFFTIVSGLTLLSGNLFEAPMLKGHLFLERSQLKTNVFSREFQKNIASLGRTTGSTPAIDLTCDLMIETKDSVRIKTELLEASAQVAIGIKNSIMRPEVSGFIALTSGEITLPYRPLYLTQGKITFIPGQLTNPLIELVAKNKIKKYNVAMHIVGSLENNNITLESTPALTKEQIVGLLCAGTPEESLAVVMPALLMHNVKNVLVDSEHSLFKFDNYFNYIFAPLRYVRLIPRFSDQTGRGGLRGAIEIDVSDRWRGLIQKNFSLTEDTRFEFEYFLSDEVSLHGFRNERRDIGGDVEVRWKF